MYHSHYYLSCSSFSYCILPNLNCALSQQRGGQREKCGWTSSENIKGRGIGRRRKEWTPAPSLSASFWASHAAVLAELGTCNWVPMGKLIPLFFEKQIKEDWWKLCPIKSHLQTPQSLLPFTGPQYLSDRCLECYFLHEFSLHKNKEI